MERVFLIGGSGFIGKNLVNQFVKEYEVHVIDKFIDERFFAERKEVNILKMDLVEEKIPENYPTPNYIINLASIVTAERDFALFDGLISSNLKILLNLYERFKNDKNLKLFIQFGSSEEYGNEGSPFKETMRECPNSPYALIKQLTVNTALMLHANYGFPSMVVRPGNLFGQYQNASKFIPYVIQQLKANEPLNVTPCEQKRDFIYAEDFAWCINQVAVNYEKSIGKIVNISSGISIELKEIIDKAKNVLCSSSVVNYGALPYRENEIMDLKCDISKMKQIIGENIDLNPLRKIRDYIND
ncbi:NAD-dependent epimerase/dehydratase family protein [Bacteroides ovatus]|uniref:NAD-dependent epimerase/dehydratase family protein n=1 Tax=Bacteroides ovatus TaxID=28116 RepID=UPI00202FDB02|nr:NAD-dependent epimerase/dehydratase family protein [Bacteroides ovatus]MCM1719082.1 NAD-dependent epimerase/dehydratase family protein [Bacteroides ovatus]MCM1758842.1 NAD-dependent epimerase/dehydratase family protein [Bacteroides ovatus]MCM1864349.1 NAD-dependent epimerase/dehydratase family protein [Bacteroides ovatus]MCM1912547.1 NAD-dependent epimerase/dehydratase family protein [Bacteroides ovatus]